VRSRSSSADGNDWMVVVIGGLSERTTFCAVSGLLESNRQ